MNRTAWLIVAGLFWLMTPISTSVAENRSSSLPSEVSVTSISSAELEIVFTPNTNPLLNDDPANFTRWVAVAEGEIVTMAVSDGDPNSISLGTPLHTGKIDLIPVVFHSDTDSDQSLSTTVLLTLPLNPPEWKSLSRSLRRTLSPLLLNRDDPSRDRDEAAGATDYIFVMPEDNDIFEIINPLIEWRWLQGYNVVVMTVPNWVPPAARADAVREYIIAEHEANLPVEYVCLIGDTGGDYVVPTFSNGMSDYPYGLLEGVDALPEAAVGRLSFNSLEELRNIVDKILKYELEPELEEVDGYNRATVCAGSQRSGLSTILVSRWIRDELLDFGYTTVDTFWYTMGNDVASFMRDAFDGGATFVNYRGWTGLENWTAHNARNLNNRHLPVALLLGCNTGDFHGAGFSYTEALLRAEGGAIGAIGVVGAQSRVNYNNALIAGYYRGVLEDGEHTLGWSLNRARLELFAAYSAAQMERVSDHVYWTNLMGDPATVIQRRVPVEVNLELPEEVSIEDGEFEVTVIDEDNNPIQGARIGLHNAADYVTAAYTNAAGVALIMLDPLIVMEGEATISVSGDGIIPSSGEIQLQQSERMIRYQRYFIDDRDEPPLIGNGDNIPNPFEVVQIDVTVANIGDNQIEGPIVFRLECMIGACEVTANRYQRNNDLGIDQEAIAIFQMRIQSNFPDLEDVPFILSVNTDDDDWELSFSIQGQASRWEIVENDLMEPPAPGQFAEFNLTLANTGSIDLDSTTAVLISLSEDATVHSDTVRYDSLQVNQSAEGLSTFLIEIDDRADFGVSVPFQLELTSDYGYTGNVSLTIDLIPPPVFEPTGPDEYGYYVIETNDRGSNLSPEFEWTELNPDRAGHGINTGILDQGEDDDASVVLQLPFSFQYYGEIFDLITVCSNGWAAFGDQKQYVDFRNMPIGSPQGPRAQLCPWWDDLYQPGRDGNIFYWYDEAEHRFIVEWDHMRRYIGPAGPGATETFQLILLDPEWHPSETGDGDIIFMYNSVSHEARVDGHGTPYATIGIGTPDDRGGLQYGFWNSWAEAATAVASFTALRFATSRDHDYGSIRGTVRKLSGGDSLEGATVRVTPGGWAITDSLGSFRINNVLRQQPLTLTASAPGFNTVSLALDMINQIPLDTLIELTHPTIEVDRGEIIDTLEVEGQVEHRFTISNNGDGDLEFSIDFTEPERGGEFVSGRDESDELWEQLQTIDVTDATGGGNGDHRILGAIYAGNRFFVSGGNNGEPENYLYEFNRRGRLVNRILQPCEDMWGMRDLAWDGEFLYGGCGSWIYKWNIENGDVDSIASPITPPRGLAVDPSDGSIWIATSGAPITHIDSEGNVLNTFSHRLAPYGLAWNADDPDDCPLYIFSNDGETHLALSKLNPMDGTLLPVTQFTFADGDRPGGCEFSLEYAPARNTLVMIIQNPDGDRLEAVNAGLNLGWLSVEPEAGVIELNSDLQVTLTLRTFNQQGGLYAVDMLIHHNAAGEMLQIPIQLFFDGGNLGGPEASPTAFAIDDIYPNPTNGAGVVRFHLTRPGHIIVDLYDSSGRRVEVVTESHFAAGSHQLHLNATDLATGIYFVSLRSSEGVLHRKFVLLK